MPTTTTSMASMRNHRPSPRVFGVSSSSPPRRPRQQQQQQSRQQRRVAVGSSDDDGEEECCYCDDGEEDDERCYDDDDEYDYHPRQHRHRRRPTTTTLLSSTAILLGSLLLLTLFVDLAYRSVGDATGGSVYRWQQQPQQQYNDVDVENNNDSVRTTTTTDTDATGTGRGFGGNTVGEGFFRAKQAADDADDANNATTTTAAETAAAVQFVFFVGLEGTGHHMVASLLKDSPAALYLKESEELGLGNQLAQLGGALYGPRRGYLNMHCSKIEYVNDTNTTTQTGGTGGKQQQQRLKATIGGGFSATEIESSRRRVVQLMNDVAAKVAAAAAVTSSVTAPSLDNETATFAGAGTQRRRRRRVPAVVSIPLNAAGFVTEMASFPQDRGPCRPLKYPSLDLLDGLCKDASQVVRCRYLYLYRDPYAVVTSTTTLLGRGGGGPTQHRSYNRHVPQAIHQYASMLYILYGQLSTIVLESSQQRQQQQEQEQSKLVGCFGLDDDDGDVGYDADRWKPIRQLFFEGYEWDDANNIGDSTISSSSSSGQSDSDNDTAGRFRSYVVSRFRAPSVPTDEERRRIERYSSYMGSFKRAHDAVVDLCWRQYRQEG